MGKCKDCRWFGQTSSSHTELNGNHVVEFITVCEKNKWRKGAWVAEFNTTGPDDGCGDFKVKVYDRKTDEDIADKKIRVLKEIIREAWTQ